MAWLMFCLLEVLLHGLLQACSICMIIAVETDLSPWWVWQRLRNDLNKTILVYMRENFCQLPFIIMSRGAVCAINSPSSKAYSFTRGQFKMCLRISLYEIKNKWFKSTVLTWSGLPCAPPDHGLSYISRTGNGWVLVALGHSFGCLKAPVLWFMDPMLLVFSTYDIALFTVVYGSIDKKPVWTPQCPAMRESNITIYLAHFF